LVKVPRGCPRPHAGTSASAKSTTKEAQIRTMDDRRRYPRKPCANDQVIEVTDTLNGRHLGRLVNISVDGFLLVGEAPVEVDTVLQLALSSAAPGGDRQLSVGAICIWSSDASSPGHYWSGFHMIDVPEEAAEFFDDLLAPSDGSQDPLGAADGLSGQQG
jgi:hypothetical protein